MSAARRAWALCLFTCLCLTAYAGLYLTSDRNLLSLPGLDDNFPLVLFGGLVGAVVGALILSRYPHNRIGWLLSLGQAGVGVGSAAGAYAARVFADHDLGPAAAGHVAAWVWHFFGTTYALVLTCALFLLVPDGRLPSRRWRPVLAALVACYVLYAGVLILAVRPADAELSLDDTPIGPPGRNVLDASSVLLLVAVLGATAALVLRLRRSTGVQRQQLRWIMASAVLLGLGIAALAVYQLVTGPASPWYALLPVYLGYASVPVCTGIAVLRYRLYDIDLIISRAFVLAVLAAFVTGGYVAVVVAIGGALGTRVDQRFWPSLVALVLVALAFQPLRQRVLTAADRLVYGRRAAPYEALADFSRRLGRAPAPSELLPTVAEAVARGVGAAHVRVTLDAPGAAGTTTTWPDEAGHEPPQFDVEVRDRGETLGRIALAMPPGRQLRPAERRLLEDFAAQAGLAFRNLRLEAELRTRVDQVGRQSEELEASRRRLLAARDDERRRTAEVIQRAVLSHLRPIAPAVRSLDIKDPAAADETLRRLEDASDAALDALRELTRGIFPVVLTHRGLVAALRAHAARIGLADILSIAPSLEHQRFDERVEAAAYFCCRAVIREAAPARLALNLEDDWLVVEATDNRRKRGHELDEQHRIVDRVAAIGGRIGGTRDPHGRFTLRVEIPVAQVSPASAQTAASRSVPKADLAM